MTFVKGKSGNPIGRKKGSKNRKSLILQELERDGSALAAAIKAKALEGDAACMSLWLTRLEPALRTRGETVEIAVDMNAPLSAQVAQVIKAILDGQLTVEAGNQIIASMEKLATVRAAEGSGQDNASLLINAFKEFAQQVPV